MLYRLMNNIIKTNKNIAVFKAIKLHGRIKLIMMIFVE